MPSKNHKKVIASSGQAIQQKNALEVIINSDDDFEHIAVEAEDMYVLNYFSLLIF